MRKLLATTLTVALGLAVLSVARAQDAKPDAAPKPVRSEAKEGDVPKEAIEAVKKKYDKAKLVKYAKWTTERKGPDGKPVKDDASLQWEIKLKVGDKRKIIAYLTADGKFVKEEEIVDYESFPADLKKAIKGNTKLARLAQAGSDRIALKVVPGEREDSAYYKVIIDNDNEFYDVDLDKDGRIRSYRKETHMEGGCHQKF